MKVYAQVAFEVPNNTDADALASLLDAIGRQLRAEDDPRAALAGLEAGGRQCYVAGAQVVAFRIDQGQWVWRADLPALPPGSNVARSADEPAPGDVAASAADGPTGAAPAPAASPRALLLDATAQACAALSRAGEMPLAEALADAVARVESAAVMAALPPRRRLPSEFQWWAKLHAAVDTLLAAYLADHRGAVPSRLVVLELLQWSTLQLRDLKLRESGSSIPRSEQLTPPATVEKPDAGAAEVPGLHKSGSSGVLECCRRHLVDRPGGGFTNCATCGRRWTYSIDPDGGGFYWYGGAPLFTVLIARCPKCGHEAPGFEPKPGTEVRCPKCGHVGQLAPPPAPAPVTDIGLTDVEDCCARACDIYTSTVSNRPGGVVQCPSCSRTWKGYKQGSGVTWFEVKQ